MKRRDKLQKRMLEIQTARGALSNSPKKITMDQYVKGYEMYASGCTKQDILAATGMTNKQLGYLLSNPLPGHEEECQSYYSRLSLATADFQIRLNNGLKSLADGMLRNAKARDKLANMAEMTSQLILAPATQRLVENSKISEGDPGWKAPHRIGLKEGERQTLKLMAQLADYSKIIEPLKDALSDPHSVAGLPKGAVTAAIDIDPESLLPATISTRALVHEAQVQEEEDFHQQFFRDFENLSEEELESFIQSGEPPESELFEPDSSFGLSDDDDD